MLLAGVDRTDLELGAGGEWGRADRLAAGKWSCVAGRRKVLGVVRGAPHGGPTSHPAQAWTRGGLRKDAEPGLVRKS